MSGARAAVIVGPRAAEIHAVARPEPGPGHVAVAVAGCGVCASNVPVWEGRSWFTYPLPPGAPGHEAWGEITAVGDGVPDFGVGDPVALLSTEAFAEHVVAPAADVVALPRALQGTPFPGEALGCGFNVARRSRFAPGDVVAVVGVGFLGAVVTKVAAHGGARVVAIARRAAALELARNMGAAETVVMDEHQRVIDQVREMTSGALCPVVIEAAGAQWPLDLAGELTGVGGRLVVAGYHQDGTRSVNMQLWNWRGIDVVNAHERDGAVARRGVAEAATAVADGWFDPTSLYTHHFSLDEIASAMDMLITRPDGLVKVLVRT